MVVSMPEESARADRDEPVYPSKEYVEKCKMHFQQLKHTDLKPSSTAKPARVSSLLWTADSNALVAASSDGSVRLWKGVDRCTAAGCHDLVSASGHQELVAISFGLLLMCSASTFRLYELQEEVRVSREVGHGLKSPINMCISLDGSLLAVGCKDDSIHIFKFPELIALAKHQFAFEANQLCFGPALDDACFSLFVAAGQGVSLLKYSQGTNVIDVAACRQAHSAAAFSICSSLSCTANARYVATGAGDATIALYDVASDLRPIGQVSRPEWPIRSLAFSHDGAFLAAGSEDRCIDVSHVPSGLSVLRLPMPAGVSSLAWHPSKYLLAMAVDEVDKNGRYEGTIRVFGYTQ